MTIKQTTIASLLALLGVIGASYSTFATPYACDITNAAGTVSFRLNEPADNVKVISSGGAVTNDIGARSKGLTVTNLGVAAGVVKVMVTRSTPAGYTQASVDLFQDNGIFVNKFEQPRGITVNKNPSSPSFGRIFVANGRQGTTAAGSLRACSDGIYMINSDDTVALDTGVTPRTAGLPLTFGTSAVDSASPLRLTVGKDDNLLYITDLSDPSGGLWVSDLDVATNSTATNVLWTIGDPGSAGATNHGSIYSAVVEGSLANGNLTVFTIDEDLTPLKSAWKYNIGSGPLPSTAAQISLGQTNINAAIKLVRGGSSNYLYSSQNRSTGNDSPSLYIFKEDGTSIANSLAATRDLLANPTAVDILRNTTSIDISPDGSTLALLRGAAFGSVTLLSLTNGVFDFAHTNSFSLGAGTASDNARDIAYDRAGNLYVVHSASEYLRIYSKGGASVVTVGTDGSFVQTVPPTLVSVAATTATANEQGPVNGVFTVTRTGDTSVPLTVNYTVAGTATAGSDYTALPGSVTFLAGASSTNITVSVINDSTAELTETVIMNLTGSASYGVTVGSATVSILVNEPTECSIALAQTENRLLEGYSASTLGFRVTRKGLIGPALTVNLTYSGTATAGVDYSGPSSVAIGANVATATISLASIDDELFEGNETATVSVASGSGYAVGTPVSASGIIVDDDAPLGTVLFSDSFNVDSSANWITNNNDGGVDSHADFAFDYSSLYVPPVPGGSSTIGLRLRLNELTGAPRNAISVSPATLNLPDDYRMKFKAWINYNGPMLDGGSGSTMHLTTGLGTTPDHANWAFYGASDGIWFDVDGDGGSTTAVGDLNIYIATAAQPDESGYYAAGTTNSPRSTTTPYYSLWGNIPAPAAQLANYPSQTGTAQAGNMGVAWHTFLVTKQTNAVSLTIDGVPIATVPADATPLGTNVFVGFEDLFAGASGAPAMSFVLVENFKVESLVAPSAITITAIRTVGSNVEIDFTAGAADSVGSFTLQSSGNVASGYGDVSSTITQLGTGSFRATRAQAGSSQFYRVRR